MLVLFGKLIDRSGSTQSRHFKSCIYVRSFVLKDFLS